MGIKQEIEDVTEIKQKRSEELQDYLKRVVIAVSQITDKEWEELSLPAQDWFNKAADAKNSKKPMLLPDFEEAEEDTEPEEKVTKRSSKKETEVEKEEQDEEKEPEEGDTVGITTKRGKDYIGKIVELSKNEVVIEVGEDELVIDRSKIETMKVVSVTKSDKKETKKEVDAADEEPADPEVGDTVAIVTKRGKKYEGEVVEIDLKSGELVINVDGDEEELNFAKLDSWAVTKKKVTKKTSKKDAEDDESDETDSKKTTKVDKKDKTAAKKREVGFSIGTETRVLIADNLDADVKEICKMLTEKEIPFKEETVKLVFTDAHKMIDLLQERKLLKVAK